MEGEHATFTNFDSADLLLFEVLNNLKLEGFIYINIEGSVTRVFAIWFDRLGLSALYIANDFQLKYMLKPQSLRISRLQYGPLMFPYGLVTTQEIRNNIFYITKQSIRKARAILETDEHTKLDKWFDGDFELPVHKVSSLHIRHVTSKEIRIIGKEKFLRIKYMWPFLNHMINVGASEAFVVGLLCWARMLTPTHNEYSSVSGIWHWRPSSEADFITRFKNDFSLRLKACQNLVELDLTPFFELEVLVNRGVGGVNWVQEQENRTTPNLAQFQDEKVFLAAVQLFKRCVKAGSKPRKENWQAYWDRRWQWAPTGAYHSQYKEDEQYRASDVFNRHKLFSLCAMPDRPLEHFLNRPPELRAWPSTKYEWGKQRAIYGVDITNFLLTGFCMGACEDVLSTVFPIGKSANEGNVRKTIVETLKNGSPYCFDFEDFNSQHSIGAMKSVLSAYFTVFNKYMSQEQTEAMAWVISSIENNYVNFKDKSGDNWVRLNGTLLSGWRLTSFMNTVLNYVYTKLMTSDCPIVSTHNGDDILAAVDNIKAVQNLGINTQKYNVRFQRTKCFLGSIAEFLRIDHLHGSGGQYLPRAVSTIVHGPTETSVPNDALALINAILTRTDEAVQRGADAEFVETLEKVQFQYVSKKWGLEIDDINSVREVHSSNGGHSSKIDETTLSKLIISTRVPKVVDVRPTVLADADVAFPGANVYAEKLCAKYDIMQYKHKIKKKLKRTILSKSQIERRSFEVTRQEVTNHSYLMASQSGMYRESIGVAKLSLARAFDIPVVLLQDDNVNVREQLFSETDTLRALTLLY